MVGYIDLRYTVGRMQLRFILQPPADWCRWFAVSKDTTAQQGSLILMIVLTEEHPEDAAVRFSQKPESLECLPCHRSLLYFFTPHEKKRHRFGVVESSGVSSSVRGKERETSSPGTHLLARLPSANSFVQRVKCPTHQKTEIIPRDSSHDFPLFNLAVVQCLQSTWENHITMMHHTLWCSRH